MDGVFMRKRLKWVAIPVLIVTFFYVGSVMADKALLQERVIRLHVVAASDSVTDQTVKLKVRDAVLERIGETVTCAGTKQEAQAKLSGMLEELTLVADQVLEQEGVADRAVVTLGEETFPRRQYDTFSLPSGVYDSLRIAIGSGEGRNWWCVVFPSLCVPAASEEVEAVAAGAGFSQGLQGTLTGRYEVRFFLLDCLGRLENLFHRG